jgi:hypothetical protein
MALKQKCFTLLVGFACWLALYTGGSYAVITYDIHAMRSDMSESEWQSMMLDKGLPQGGIQALYLFGFLISGPLAAILLALAAILVMSRYWTSPPPLSLPGHPARRPLLPGGAVGGSK